MTKITETGSAVTMPHSIQKCASGGTNPVKACSKATRDVSSSFFWASKWAVPKITITWAFPSKCFDACGSQQHAALVIHTLSRYGLLPLGVRWWQEKVCCVFTIITIFFDNPFIPKGSHCRQSCVWINVNPRHIGGRRQEMREKSRPSMAMESPAHYMFLPMVKKPFIAFFIETMARMPGSFPRDPASAGSTTIDPPTVWPNGSFWDKGSMTYRSYRYRRHCRRWTNLSESNPSWPPSDWCSLEKRQSSFLLRLWRSGGKPHGVGRKCWACLPLAACQRHQRKRPEKVLPF